MKIVLVAILALAGIAGSQWYYQPSVETSAVASAVLCLLLIVVSWSAVRFGTSLQGMLKTLVVGLVAGLMFSQAMDVGYSLLSAPAGGRLGFPWELVAIGVGLALFAQLFAFALRPKVEKESDGH